MNERQLKILSYIKNRGEVRNKELLTILGGCTNMTLWRDLTLLENEGKIKRGRGTVMLVGGEVAGSEERFSARIKQNMSGKEELAGIACPLILQNHSYYLDAGSTIFSLTKRLDKNGRYTVITSAVNIAEELTKRGNNNVTLLGGQVNNYTLASSGPNTESMLRDINIDVAIMATSGYFSNVGFTGGYLPEAELKRQVLEKAFFTFMLMDSDKFGKSHPFTFATLKDIDILIGDSNLSRDFINAAGAEGVTVFTPNDGLSPSDRIEIYQSLIAKKY